MSKIAPELLRNANIVIRFEEEHIVLQSLDKVLIKHHYVITILNDEGARFARLVESYDNFQEIKSIDGILYDAYGIKLKSLKSKDVEDLSGSGGSNLADDSRFKVHDFYYKIYPYTVEYNIETVKGRLCFSHPGSRYGMKIFRLKKAGFL
ncbi:MAG: DUF3857 domain-containing protein [Chitinophagaceae bacterium]|nr:DUF3857 domain-containing protein [Chitinophagaceae bacterium]